MKRIRLVLLVMFIILSLTGCNAVKKQDKDIHIFYTSDVHCGVDENLSFAELKALVNDTEGKGNYTALVDVGDFLQGGSYGTLSQGSIIIDLMNAMDYDVVTFGNHEYDYGMARLKELIGMANFQMIASNARYTGEKENVFEGIPEYMIKEFGSTKVAFIGVLLPTTITTSTPSYFMEDGKIVYDFYAGNDGQNLYDKIQSVVDEVRRNGADYVIALTHLGSDLYLSPYDSVSFISHTTGIDVVLDGHSHSVIIGDEYPDAEGKDVILSSVGTRMENVGQLIIGKDGSLTTMLISEYDREDETVRKAIDDANTKLDEILSREVGEISDDMIISDNNNIRLIRNRETNLGDFVADAIRNSMNTDVAIYNGGSIRHELKAGKVTYGDLLNVLPFYNILSSCRCSGQVILDTLEFCSRNTEGITGFDDRAVGECGGFMQVSGLKYTINTSIPSACTVDDNGMFTGINGKRRVSDVYVLQQGQYVPLDVNAMYTLASNRYVIVENGDGITTFNDCELIIDQGPVELEALISWMEMSQRNPFQYGNQETRITVK